MNHAPRILVVAGEVSGDMHAAKVVELLKKSGAPTWSAKPMWQQDNYWCFPVRDPMGNTVEVFTIPEEKPADTGWPE